MAYLTEPESTYMYRNTHKHKYALQNFAPLGTSRVNGLHAHRDLYVGTGLIVAGKEKRLEESSSPARNISVKNQSGPLTADQVLGYA